MLRNFLILASTACIVTFTAFDATAEPYKRGDKYLSKLQLQENGPVRFALGNGGSFRIISVTYVKDPQRNCKLQIPELRKLIESQSGTVAWKKKAKKSVPITFELKAEVVEGLGELVCFGTGTGCTVTIEGKV